jgi:hypothetical protein
MALTYRTVNISLEQQTAKAVTLRFTPNLTGASDEVLLQKAYSVTTATDGTASINLPVSDEGGITYTFEIPGEAGRSNRGKFTIEPGNAIALDDLINLGVSATPTLIDVIQSYMQSIDGGTPGSVYLESQAIDGGGA